jgi:predicted dinucleotide-binding enzyme
MKIGIIGAGHIGGTLARKFSVAGHTVLLASARGPDALRVFANEVGATAVPVTDAAKNVDVVIVSIPEKNIPLLPKDLFAGVPEDVVVVDTGNYYPGVRDEPIEEIENGMLESVWVSKQLGRPVVKAFNNILADSLANNGRPAGAEDRIALPVEGDDPRAKKIVIGLVDAAGFDGIDAGTLGESWRQQPGNPAYCTDLQADDLRLALSAADKVQAPKLRDLALQKLGQLGEHFTNEDIINMNRSLHPLFRKSAEE